jgi:hypothetical protein
MNNEFGEGIGNSETTTANATTGLAFVVQGGIWRTEQQIPVRE